MVQRVRESMKGVWQEVRNLGIVVPRAGLVVPHALNPEELPLQLAQDGQMVLVPEVQFDYLGPATALQFGVGWKATTPLDFNDGLNLISEPRAGWGFSPLLPVDESASFVHYTLMLAAVRFILTLWSPSVGLNTAIGGREFDIGSGRQVDAWIWLYDTAVLGAYAFGPDTEFLGLDEDSGVIRMPEEVVPEVGAVRNLEIRYSLSA